MPCRISIKSAVSIDFAFLRLVFFCSLSLTVRHATEACWLLGCAMALFSGTRLLYGCFVPYFRITFPFLTAAVFLGLSLTVWQLLRPAVFWDVASALFTAMGSLLKENWRHDIQLYMRKQTNVGAEKNKLPSRVSIDYMGI